MMQTTAAMSVRKRLTDLLAIELPDFQISYGQPDTDYMQHRAMWCYGVEGAQYPNAKGATRVRRREDLSFSWTIGVLVEGATLQEEADEIALRAFAVAENTLAANPRLTAPTDEHGELTGPDLGVAAVSIGEWELSGGQHDRGRVAVLDFTVDVMARLA